MQSDDLFRTKARKILLSFRALISLGLELSPRTPKDEYESIIITYIRYLEYTIYSLLYPRITHIRNIQVNMVGVRIRRPTVTKA